MREDIFFYNYQYRQSSELRTQCGFLVVLPTCDYDSFGYSSTKYDRSFKSSHLFNIADLDCHYVNTFHGKQE